MTTFAPAAGLALRISVTDRCPLHCVYCRPRTGREPAFARELLQVSDIVRFVCAARTGIGVAKVRLTGGEPLARPDIVEIVAALGELKLPDLALTTNGQRLAAIARALRDAGLHRINVSLDTLVQDTFARLAQGGAVKRTLDGIEAAATAGLHPIRINTVVLRGINDHEAEALLELALARGCELRFIELMPSDLSSAKYARWFMPSDELRERLGRTFELSPEPPIPGSSSRRWRVASRHGLGFLGFISPGSHPFCSQCRRLRLTADGRLLGCLGRREDIRILDLLHTPAESSDDRIVAAMHAALECKRETGWFSVATPMSRVGG